MMGIINQMNTVAEGRTMHNLLEAQLTTKTKITNKQSEKITKLIKKKPLSTRKHKITYENSFFG